MNAIVNKFLLAGDTFMPKMRLRQPELTYSACAPFITIKKEKKLKETGDSRQIYQNELDKACFQHDMASLFSTGADTSSFTKRIELANLKSDVDKFDID